LYSNLQAIIFCFIFNENKSVSLAIKSLCESILPSTMHFLMKKEYFLGYIGSLRLKENSLKICVIKWSLNRWIFKHLGIQVTLPWDISKEKKNQSHSWITDLLKFFIFLYAIFYSYISFLYKKWICSHLEGQFVSFSPWMTW
jgi:hypothetical protein